MTTTLPHDLAVIGRTEELQLIDELIAAARAGSGGTLSLSGEPGTGKTKLLEAARQRAEGLDVLQCVGVQWEAELPFSGLHELLTPVIDRLDALPQPQRVALEIALGRRAADTPHTIDTYAAVVSLVLELTRKRPVLIIIDDLQWIDEASARTLAFLARRIETEAVAVLVASRPGTLLPGVAAPRSVGPLSSTAVAALVERALGRPVDPSVAGRIAESTGGNALAVLEVVRRVGTDLHAYADELDGPMPVGELLEAKLSERVSSLTDSARAAIEVVATSLVGDPAVHRAALLELGIPAHGLQEAIDAGQLEHTAGRWRFCHPLLRSIVHEGMDPVRRREIHAAFARIVDDPVLQVCHEANAAIGEDEGLAERVAQVAETLVRRGGPVVAARLLERAAELTVDPDRKAHYLVAASRCGRHASGPSGWLVAIAEAAARSAREPALRAEAEFELLALKAMGPAFPGFDEAFLLASQAESLRPELSAHALRAVCTEGMLTGERTQTLRALSSIRRLASVYPVDGVQDAWAESLLVGVLFGQVDRETLVRAAERYRDRLRSSDPEHAADRLAGALGLVTLVEALTWMGEFDLARRITAECLDRARRSGEAQAVGYALFVQGQLHYRLGDWNSAEESYGVAEQLSESIDARAHAVSVRMARACLLAARGRDPGDLEALESAAVEDWHLAIGVEYVGHARALLALGAGDPSSAVAALDRVAAWKQSAGHVEPCIGSWPVDHVEALLLDREYERATEALGRLRALAQAPHRGWARAGVCRIEAMLAPDLDDAGRHFERALELCDDARSPFDHGRTHLAYGQRLSRGGRVALARTQFERAAEIFVRLDAQSWLMQAQRELGRRATGEVGAADPNELTPQERQVAALVAAGATNKEAAGELFLSPKTVESHLSRIYRKLGVSSRTQLAARWNDHGTGPRDEG